TVMDGSIYLRPPAGWMLQWTLGISTLFCAGALLALISHHSMSGVVLNIVLFGIVRALDLIYLYEVTPASLLLIFVYLIQDVLYFLALLAGADLVYRRWTAPRLHLIEH